jgi:glycosyltransferase involved in cell wall biosynthesis
MRIAILIPSLEKGGIERSISRISNGLLDLGWEVDLLIDKSSLEAESYFDQRINFIKLKAGHFDQNKNLFFSLLKNILLFIKIKTYLKRSNTKIILAAKNIPLGILLKLTKGNRLKIIIREAVNPTTTLQLQRNLISRTILKLIKKLSYPYANRIIAISNGVKDSLVKDIGIDPTKIHVVYNPSADPNIIKFSKEIVPQEFLKSDIPTLISIGRLVPQKDYMTLLKAFNISSKKLKSRLVIIGEGQERSSIEKYVKDKNMDNEIILLGYQSNPWKYLTNSDLFILSSKWEGFGNVIVEAMLLGIPVISSDCPSGPSEILEKGKLGDLFSVGDHNRLATLIEEKLNNIDQSRDKADLAKKASSLYSIEIISKQYDDILSK